MDYLYKKKKNVISRWASFENPDGRKGAGGMANKGAKGHAFQTIHTGEAVTLLNTTGPGIIRRIWMTLYDYSSPRFLRSIKFEIYWDDASTPAVSVPMGDLFGVSLGLKVPFQSALFSDPEGRSFNCYIPMPFKKSARVVFTNESENDATLFYDIDYTLGDTFDDDAMYFHAHWRRESMTAIARDFEILPAIKGAGRFLGTTLGVVENPDYKGTWFGEGEVKIYIDGDAQYPTLVGTGTEDYIGCAWGQGVFNNMYQGCLVRDMERGQSSFYRYHVPDPVYFDNECRVTIQQIGGAMGDKIHEILSSGVKLALIREAKGEEKPYSVIEKTGNGEPLDIIIDNEGFYLFYRRDDVCATAYFYLNSPENGLPTLKSLEDRIEGIK